MGVIVTKRNNANHIDTESRDGNKQKTFRFDIWGIDNSTEGSRKDEERDDNQKESVDEPGKNLNSVVTI